MIKLDLSEAYNMVSWLYLDLMLIHFCFSLPMVKRIMGFVTTISFEILINSWNSIFIKFSRGLRQVFLLSSYLLLLVVEGLRRKIKEEKGFRNIEGVMVGRTKSLSHLPFIDDVLLYFLGFENEGIYFNNILQIYSATPSMEIEVNNFTLCNYGLHVHQLWLWKEFSTSDIWV